MKKGNLLLLIITLIIISMVIVFSLIIIESRKNYSNLPIAININTEIKEVTDRNNYFMVKNCVDKFYKYYATMFDTKEDVDIDKTYILLDKKYIEFKGITQENILTVLPRLGDAVTNISNMYVSKQSDNISVYIVEGTLREELTNGLSNFKIMIQVDLKNKTFSVLPQDYIESKYKEIKLGNKLKVQPLNELEPNRYNYYLLEEITDSTYSIELFKDFQEEVLYNVDLAYEHIDEEYKNVKFATLGKFKEHVEQNRIKYTNMEIMKYQKTENDDYVQYVCIDNNGHYYIFKEKGIMNYSLILDTYTIDLPDFIEKYDKANTIQKVGYNIQRCIDAINYKDYEYVYNKLDLEFKAMNYPILERFSNELENKLFNQNKVKDVDGSHEGDTYIYKLTITDAVDDTKEQKMTIIMQLKRGTDFVMSLSFQ